MKTPLTYPDLYIVVSKEYNPITKRTEFTPLDNYIYRYYDDAAGFVAQCREDEDPADPNEFAILKASELVAA